MTEKNETQTEAKLLLVDVDHLQKAAGFLDTLLVAAKEQDPILAEDPEKFTQFIALQHYKAMLEALMYFCNSVVFGCKESNGVVCVPAPPEAIQELNQKNAEAPPNTNLN